MAKVYDYVCPCKDCDKRTESCHSICKEYNDWADSGKQVEKQRRFERFTKKDYEKRQRQRFKVKRV